MLIVSHKLKGVAEVEGVARRPVPVSTELTQPFWDAARERRLAIQRCVACGRYQHPPNTICPRCLSTDLAWANMSGKGTVIAYTVMNEPVVNGFEQVIPYACVIVELAEQSGLLILTNLVEAPASAARVGLEVELTFESTDRGFVLPQFRPRP
jgi:uncharacterized OB-fold protein